ncbi:MAG: carbohydrate-binding family 9-like protein [Clostridia bacterium]|nr:carbohydrate-binding family 9-like protein [Clostridia bacterium]
MYRINKVDCTKKFYWEKAEKAYISNYMWMNNEYEPKVMVQMCYDDEALRVRFEVEESMPRSIYTVPNEPVYKDSCVEFFVQPTPESDQRYLNFEMNSKGTLLLGLGEGRHERQQPKRPNGIGFDIKSKVQADRWSVSYVIPFTWLSNIYPDFAPVPGHVMKANFYKCGDDTALPHYGSWHIVTSENPDFHRPCDFGEIVFQ